MSECARCQSELVEGEDENVVCMGCSDHLIPHEHGGYGYFPGGDPRCFTPDSEESGTTTEERAAWEAACARWDKAEREGKPVLAEPGSCTHETLVDPTTGKPVGRAIVTRARFGLGGYSYPCSDPNCPDSWPPDPPEPDEAKFLNEARWEAALAEGLAGDDELEDE